MENNTYIIRNIIYRNNDKELCELLKSGFDPNFEGGWPIRLAARHGYHDLVKTLIKFGANPHIPGESGASTLQLAVFSGENWDSDKWTFLLSFCDSSQLADGAAVAIIFNNVPALRMILDTGRCNTNIPTTLTGKTLEQLAKGYKLTYVIKTPTLSNDCLSPTSSEVSIHRMNTRVGGTPQQARTLSPSVARFFSQTSRLSLTPRRAAQATLTVSSPSTH